MNWRNVLSKSFSAGALRSLPESFIFGVANSDHQTEAYDPQLEDIRDIWERERGLEVRGRATEVGARKVVVQATLSAEGEVRARGKVVAVLMPEHMRAEV